jgi:hypothetical protein
MWIVGLMTEISLVGLYRVLGVFGEAESALWLCMQEYGVDCKLIGIVHSYPAPLKTRFI